MAVQCVPDARVSLWRGATEHGATAARLVCMRRASAHSKDEQLLDKAFEGLERETPDRVTMAIRWLRDPKSRWLRMPLGILCILGGFFWFLPILGLELFPIGLLLIAQDVPFLQRPVAKLMLWLEAKLVKLRRRYQRKRTRTR